MLKTSGKQGQRVKEQQTFLSLTIFDSLKANKYHTTNCVFSESNI